MVNLIHGAERLSLVSLAEDRWLTAMGPFCANVAVLHRSGLIGMVLKLSKGCFSVFWLFVMFHHAKGAMAVLERRKRLTLGKMVFLMIFHASRLESTSLLAESACRAPMTLEPTLGVFFYL